MKKQTLYCTQDVIDELHLCAYLLGIDTFELQRIKCEIQKRNPSLIQYKTKVKYKGEGCINVLVYEKCIDGVIHGRKWEKEKKYFCPSVIKEIIKGLPEEL